MAENGSGNGNGNEGRKALDKGVALGIAPTMLMVPLGLLAGFGPCGPAIAEGAAPLVILLVVGALTCFGLSLRYFRRSYSHARVTTGLLGGGLTVWNAMLSFVLVFILLAALA